jgi:ParB family chromosome partitioning protein
LDIKIISIDQIAPNGYNPNIVPDDIMAKLRAEIAQKGLTQPIIVRSSGNAYEIVDGYHRWRICRDLGFTEVPCIVQDYSDTEAKIKTLQLNYMRGSAVPIKLASLIHDLNRDIKLEDLAKRLPYEEPQMLDSLELLKLPEDFAKEIEEQALKEEGELPSVISFVAYKTQLDAIEEAISIASKEFPEGTKNLRALALEKVCLEYIAQQKVKTKTEVSVVAG